MGLSPAAATSPPEESCAKARPQRPYRHNAAARINTDPSRWPPLVWRVTIKTILAGKAILLKPMSAYRSDTPDKASPSRAGSLTLVGGALCLNFVNTSSGRGTARRLEHLRRFEHLVAWAHHAKAIDKRAARALARQAARSP